MTTPSIRTAQWPVDSSPRFRSRAGTIAIWTVQIATAAMFLFVGSLKLAGVPEMVGLFDAIGIGQWFRYLTGSIEVVAILLLVPSLAFFGALLLVPTMVGAVLTHLFIVGGNPAPALVLGAAAAAIAWTRRRGR